LLIGSLANLLDASNSAASIGFGLVARPAADVAGSIAALAAKEEL
jgi:hypothetical protein